MSEKKSEKYTKDGLCRFAGGGTGVGCEYGMEDGFVRGLQ
jgi:hypothetical protein